MVGERIRQARMAAGLSQDEVVARLGSAGLELTKGGLSKYERGGSVPKATLLRGLARVLSVETGFFLENPSVAVHWLAFRKAPRLSRARQEQVKSRAETQLEIVVGLRRSLRVPEWQEPLPRIPVHTPDEAEKAAEQVREYWQLGAQPIESVTQVIEDNGGVVVECSVGPQFDGLAGWANQSIPVVAVSADAPDDRRRFSLAHEIGHLFMEIDPSTSNKVEERLAHRFAAAFLVPAETALRELGPHRRRLDFEELAILKLKHGLSMQAWIYRAADLGILEASTMRSLVAAMATKGWRRREPVPLFGKERPLQLQQLLLRAMAEGLLAAARAEKIWPGITSDRSSEAFSEEDPRSFSLLPAAERNRRLAAAAEALAPAYEPGGALFGLESLAEEDYFELSPAE